MRTLLLLATCTLALALAACSDSPTSTTTTGLGKTTIEAIATNAGYSWYQLGYDSYPDASQKARFDMAVASIQQNKDGAKIVMVIKPNCSCQKTQVYFPQAIKTLDAAGIPRDQIEVYVTDTRMAGVDSIKTALGIASAPTFVVLKNGVEKGRMTDDPVVGSSVDNDLATFFAKP